MAATIRPTDGMAPFLELGKEQTAAVIALQKRLLDAYGQSSCAWLDRIRSETKFWSDVATMVTAPRSVPEALMGHQQCIAERIRMIADDGRRLCEDGQKIVATITQTMSDR
ncbi:MAG TPA: hypothetical protein VJ924_07305 [Alphaproteobacteria bacterium]|nr:hypothetical protein [Alphaproteobacteria bacterium]